MLGTILNPTSDISLGNTIKALNWYVTGGIQWADLFLFSNLPPHHRYTSVREKLDDPAYAGWFMRFKDYKGPQSNHSYHVPACTYERCSAFSIL